MGLRDGVRQQIVVAGVSCKSGFNGKEWQPFAVVLGKNGINRHGGLFSGGWGRGGILTGPKAGKDDSEGKEGVFVHRNGCCLCCTGIFFDRIYRIGRMGRLRRRSEVIRIGTRMTRMRHGFKQIFNCEAKNLFKSVSHPRHPCSNSTVGEANPIL